MTSPAQAAALAAFFWLLSALAAIACVAYALPLVREWWRTWKKQLPEPRQWEPECCCDRCTAQRRHFPSPTNLSEPRP